MAMTHEEPGFSARTGKAKPIGDIVEAPFKQNQQGLAGDAFGARGFGESTAELIFQQTVHPLDLLLFAQLQAVLGELRPALAMLSRRIVTALDGALVGITALSFEKELEVFSPAQPAHGICISSQTLILLC